MLRFILLRTIVSFFHKHDLSDDENVYVYIYIYIYDILFFIFVSLIPNANIVNLV